MAGKSINELPEITSVSDSSLMALSSDGKTLGRVAARTLKNSVVGQHISNYIRYINQDIKLELNDGTLTVKAGSKVYVPNGVGVFDEVIIESDLSLTSLQNRTGVLYYSKKGAIYTEQIDRCYSGSSYSGGTYGLWYDTTNNKIGYTGDSGSSWSFNDSLPLAICTVTTNGVTSIDQVFNGFGYIGSTIFALPGTVVSMPNGKEENGVLKNTEVEITSVRTVTLGSADTTDYIGYLSPTGIDYMLATNYYESAVPPTNKNGYAMWLNTQDNHFYVKNFSVSGSEWELVDALGNICKFTTSSGKITKFESKSVLSLLDTSTFNLVPHIVETWSNGTSWYRLYSDGWCEQGGWLTPNSDPYNITFLKEFKDTNYYIQLSVQDISPTDFALTVASWNTKTTTYVQIYEGYNGTSQLMPIMWETKGYVA